MEDAAALGARIRLQALARARELNLTYDQRNPVATCTLPSATVPIPTVAVLWHGRAQSAAFPDEIE
jgi:hypothetical protein